jgi:hypothetical protein
MISVNYLLKNVHNKDPNLRILKIYHEPYYYQVIVFNPLSTTKKPQHYVVRIECNEEHLTRHSKVKISCDCHDFRYRFAYCLYQNDSLFFTPAFLLKYPEKTNPNCEIKSCKHIYTALNYILAKNPKFTSSENILL